MNLKKIFSSLFVGIAFSVVAYLVYAAFVIQSVPVNTCTDSDGYQNFLVSGNVTGINITNSTYFFPDTCLSNITAKDWSCILRSGQLLAVEYGENCTAVNKTSCFNGKCI
mgnify:CR=1 FL=1